MKPHTQNKQQQFWPKKERDLHQTHVHILAHVISRHHVNAVLQLQVTQALGDHLLTQACVVDILIYGMQ